MVARNFGYRHELSASVFGDELSKQIVERIHYVNQNAGVVAAK